ncbi:MAG TPA: hypothetical protein VKA26_12245 [Ignavibacteriaceae bacterium]|nr:hypothetical protein [Ignavibacteriaceae bacterium]
MELIPILSTIILVATISTFILAIGAYILYKTRESKGQQVIASQPKSVEAELYTPVIERKVQGKPAPDYVQTPFSTGYKSREPIFAQERSQVQTKATPQFQRYSGEKKTEPVNLREKTYKGQVAPIEKEKKLKDSKFLKYTSEGYVDPKTDKSTGALKWR